MASRWRRRSASGMEKTLRHSTPPRMWAHARAGHVTQTIDLQSFLEYEARIGHGVAVQANGGPAGGEARPAEARRAKPEPPAHAVDFADAFAIYCLLLARNFSRTSAPALETVSESGPHLCVGGGGGEGLNAALHRADVLDAAMPELAMRSTRASVGARLMGCWRRRRHP